MRLKIIETIAQIVYLKDCVNMARACSSFLACACVHSSFCQESGGVGVGDLCLKLFVPRVAQIDRTEAAVKMAGSLSQFLLVKITY